MQCMERAAHTLLHVWLLSDTLLLLLLPLTSCAAQHLYAIQCHSHRSITRLLQEPLLSAGQHCSHPAHNQPHMLPLDSTAYSRDQQKDLLPRWHRCSS